MIDLARFRDIDLVDRWKTISEAQLTKEPDKRDKFYQGYYRYILSHLATCQFDGTRADCERFWQGLILVYSWMGRGLLHDFEKPFERYMAACEPLRAARDGNGPTASDLKPLLSICQDRVVGLSKLLHFVGASNFAIWDQWVAKAVFVKAHHVNDMTIYSAYLDWIRSAHIDDKTLSEVCEQLQLNPAVPSLRPKEFILFTSGRLSRTAQPQTLAVSAS
jgi:hypothetical protein